LRRSTVMVTIKEGEQPLGRSLPKSLQTIASHFGRLEAHSVCDLPTWELHLGCNYQHRPCDLLYRPLHVDERICDLLHDDLMPSILAGSGCPRLMSLFKGFIYVRHLSPPLCKSSG